MATTIFTTTGLNKIAAGGMTATQFPYIGIGSGTATPAEALAAMGTETLRQAVTDVTGIGIQANHRDYLTNSQANATLSEVGHWTASSGGTLLAYQLFTTPIVKSSSRPMIVNSVMVLKNLDSAPGLTWAGLAAARAGGFTNTSMPYIASYASAVTFDPFMDTLSGEVERVACTWGISGAVATGSGTIVAATSTVGAIALWSASSGGTLLGYTAFSGGNAAHHTIKFVCTVANSA